MKPCRAFVSRIRHPLLRLWAPVVVYMAAIFYASSLSQPPVPAGSDKPVHAIAYFGLGLVTARAVAGGLPRPITMRQACAIALIALGYGVTDEVHQMFVAGRSADWRDLLADAAGVVAATVLCWAWGIIAPGSRDEL